MPTYSVTITDDEDKALRTEFVDPQAWIEGLVRARVLEAANTVIRQEIDRRLEAGEPIPESREEILRVAQPKSAVQISEERAAAAARDLPPADPHARVISDRQFFQALAKPEYGLITQEEAMAAVRTGDIPATLQTAISQAEAAGLFPPGVSRFDVEIMISGATQFERDHPVSTMIAGVFGWTEDETTAFWDFAARL